MRHRSTATVSAAGLGRGSERATGNPSAITTAGEKTIEQCTAIFAGKRPIRDAPRGRLQARTKCRALLGSRLTARLAEQVEQSVAQRRGGRQHGAHRIGPLTANQTIGVLARKAAWRAATCGQAPVAAVPALRHGRRHGCPRHRRRSRGSVQATSRQSSSSCSSRQRRAEWRDGAADPDLRETDHVHVAFDHHQRRTPSYRLARQIQRVERAALGEQRRLRPVDVFRLTIA